MGTISRITTFSTGDTLTASDLNGEFDNIISTANGSINADNLGVTAGQASASKAIVLDANKDFANVTTSNQIRNLTISGSLKIGTTFLPDAAGGADLGSTSLEWGDVYVADDKYLYMGSDQNIKIGYDETTTDSLAISAIEGAGLAITLRADEGDDAGDEWKLNVADGGVVTFGNDIASAGTFVTHLTLTPHATVASSTLALAGGLTVAGATQANSTVTVGVDDQGYDVKLFGDTASAYLMWDTSADKLLTAGGATIDIVKDKLLIGGVAVTTTAAELNLLDTASAGTVVASKAVVVDSNKDIASFRNVTLTGELDAATGDFSGDVDVDGTLEADAITLGGTALGSLYSPIAGSSSIVTVGTVGTGTWQGTAVALAYGGTGLVGATDGKIVIADGSGAPVLLDVGSSTAITVLGTVATGTWQGTAVASAYLDADTAHLSTTQTFSGAKTFSAAAQFSNTVTVGVDDTGYDVKFFGATSGSSLLWDESADDLIFTNAGLAVGSDATGDIYYRNSSGFLARLGASTDGYVLTTGGTGTIPAWEEAAGGGHTIQEEGSNLTQRTNLNFVGAGVTATDDSGNNATKVTVTPTGASLPVTRSDGSTSDPIALTSAALGESLVSDTSPQLGGNLDVNGQSIVSDASNENIPITPHGTGSVVISKLSVTGDTSLDGGSFVFNESGADKDFRIEGDTQANLFVADASTDRIGIGTAAPDGPLHIMSASAGTVTADSNADELVVEGSGNSGITILSATTSQGNIAFGDSGNAKQGVFGFHQGNAEFNWSQATQQMVLDSSGRLGVGCNAPSSYQVNADSKAIVIGTGGTSGSPNVHLTLASDDTGNGRIAFTDTVDSTNQAYMRYDHNNANWDFTTTQSGGLFKFSPNTGGNSIMQIGDASSNLIVGVGNGAPSTDAMLTSQTSSNDHKVFHGKHTSSVATEPYGIQLDFTAASPDNNTRWFVKLDDSTATRGYWYSDGDVWTSDAGTLTSDERLKTNIVDASDKLADVMRLKVRNFEWTTDYHPAKGGEKKLGFIAQELETVFPSLITEHDIALDNKIEEELYKPQDEIPNGKEIGDVKVEAKAHEPTMRKAYKNAFAPILVKALQEVTVRLEAAEAKIAALESA
jgi:hypothetical protein